jgi:vacuolar-type H+-ATPase subunit E/Vma4
MARAALIEALRSQAARDVAAAHESARSAAERRRAELAAELEQERLRLEQDVAAEARRVAAQGLAEAGHRGRESAAAATVTLAERLLTLALAELPGLAGPAREQLFAALARELPPCAWECVRVNPADAELAARQFPGAVVETAPGISGGVEASCAAGRIAVSNTLETRLVTAWPDLLPELLADLSVEASTRGTAA